MRDIGYRVWIIGCLVGVLALGAAACGSSATDSSAPSTSAAAAPTKPGELTPFQIEHGIGPITEPVTLAAVDKTLADAGAKVFEQKCASCHKMDELRDGLRSELDGRRGMLAHVVDGGEIALGDAVELA